MRTLFMATLGGMKVNVLRAVDTVCIQTVTIIVVEQIRLITVQI